VAEQTPNPAQDLTALWAQHQGRFQPSRDLIEVCGKWERDEIKPIVPTRDGVLQGFPVTLPHATTMPQDVASFVARRQPSFHRKPLGGGTRADKAASDIETWLQEAFASKILIDGEPLWDTLCAFGTHDAEYAVIVQPAQSHYSGLLNLFEDDGKTFRAEWRRNADGLDPAEYAARTGSAKGFSVSSRKSREAQQAYARDYKSRRWPFVVRVLSAPEYLPIGRDPLSGRLDTLLIRSVCSASHLRAQGFDWWSSMQGAAHETSLDNSGRTYWLYELHTSNPWRIVYQIVGLDNSTVYNTTKDGQPAQLGIDLGKQFKLQHLLAGVFYGWHRSHEKDPARRGIPLIAPFRGIMGAANRSITGIVEHNYQTGYGGWGIEMNPELYQVWIEMGKPQQFDLEPDAIHVLLGKPTSLVHQGVGQDAWRIFEFLQGLVERFNESERVRTSPDASSIAQTTSLASADTVLSQIANGALQAMKLVAESLLELTAVLSEEMGASIPVYCTLTRDGQEQTHVELSAKDLMGDFTVDVEQPTKKGSNLPKAQAGVSWKETGLISKYTWLQDFYGEDQPEAEMDRIASEQYVDGQEGQHELSVLVSKMLADKERQTILGLQDQGKLSPGGTPSTMLPPRPANQNGVAPNGVPMPMQPNPAASSLGGQMAAALNPGAQANVVTATGTGAETAVP
jgi:hypothetical protein